MPSPLPLPLFVPAPPRTPDGETPDARTETPLDGRIRRLQERIREGLAEGSLSRAAALGLEQRLARIGAQACRLASEGALGLDAERRLHHQLGLESRLIYRLRRELPPLPGERTRHPARVGALRAGAAL